MKEYIIAFEYPVTESSERIEYQVQQKIVGELIRCKDCKYSVDEYGDNECYCRNRLNGTYLVYIKDWDHYCSWAERKE